jgi:hypothetical protein
MPKDTTARTPIQAQLDATTVRFRRAEDVVAARRLELHDAIVDATAELSYSEIARRTGYTREYVAKICGAAGH